ncbi:MAG: barstar family protein [Lachnospiraceae bacterium]|nr:barstar family protein [Lachnospiraceae bacterium]
MMEIILDLEKVCTADEFYDLLDEKLELPAYFGRNLDALYDVLTEIREETELRIIHTDSAAVAMPRFFRGLKRMAADLREENAKVCLNIE